MLAGNYPSKGASGERGAWFRDSEGNMRHRPARLLSDLTFGGPRPL
jgi:hypothetical protein